MENLLNLLNTRGTDFAAVPTGGKPSITTADVCAALSYAKLKPVQMDLITLIVLNRACDKAQQGVLVHLSQAIAAKHPKHAEHAILLARLAYAEATANAQQKQDALNRSLRSRAKLTGLDKGKFERGLAAIADWAHEELDGQLAIALDKFTMAIRANEKSNSKDDKVS